MVRLAVSKGCEASKRGDGNTGQGGLLRSLVPVLSVAEVLHENAVPTVHLAWRHRIIVKRETLLLSVWKLTGAITSYLIYTSNEIVPSKIFRKQDYALKNNHANSLAEAWLEKATCRLGN